MAMNNKFTEATNLLIEKTLSLRKSFREGTATMGDFEGMKDFIERHFDELNLSPLLHELKCIDCEKEFNAYMALLNKHLGMSKELIPFELGLQNYVLADKIMKNIKYNQSFSNPVCL